MSKYRIPTKAYTIGSWPRPLSCNALQDNRAYCPINWWTSDVKYSYMRFRYWSEVNLEAITVRVERVRDEIAGLGAWDV